MSMTYLSDEGLKFEMAECQVLQNRIEQLEHIAEPILMGEQQ